MPSNINDQDSSFSRISPLSLRYNQNYRSRNDSDDNKVLSDIDREEIALQQMVFPLELTDQNGRIAVYGRSYLKPPGLGLLNGPGYYIDQEQEHSTQSIRPEETFIVEDEEGFQATDEVEEFVEEPDELEEGEHVSTW